MRVLWVGHFVPYPPRGGAPQRSFNLLREASRHSEVHFVGTSLRGHQRDIEDVEAARKALSEFCASVVIRPEHLRSAPLGKAWNAAKSLLNGRSYGESWLVNPATRRMVREAIGRVRPDVVHLDIVIIEGLLPLEYSGPAVMNHHNIESHMMERRSLNSAEPLAWFMRREGRLLAALERRTAPRFGRHLVVSRLDGERLREVAPDARYEVIANGVDVDYFRPMEVIPEPKTLVFAGRMNWYPNEHAMCRFLAELWPEIRRREPQARLVIAGMNPTAKLRRAAGDDPAITITGFVEDIRPIIAKAAVYVCPILDGGGTRLKLLDAMAMGKAIVATPLAVEGIDVVDGREVVVREFGERFQDAVIGALGGTIDRQRLGREARERVVSLYAWEQIGAKLVQTYREVLPGETAVRMPTV